MAMRVWLRVDLPADEPAALQREFPAVEFLVGDSISDDVLANTDVIFLTRMPEDDVIDRMSGLRWLHSTMGGARGMLTDAVKKRPITVSSSRGAQATPMSEFAIACMLTLRKRILTCRDLQAERKAKEIAALRPETMDGATVFVVGLGAIGSAVAQKCQALGLRVVATKLRVTEKPPYVDEVHTPEHFTKLAQAADVVVFCAPPTPLTKGIVSDELLRGMKPSSVIINLVTRNAVEDEAAIVAALKKKRLAGAAFSVAGSGPSPAPESELWDLPNVIVCPGMAAYDPRKWQRLREIFVTNLRRFQAGEPLLNLGDAQAGY
jgi:phosphoglycerate dehydrogenase-like enzyme